MSFLKVATSMKLNDLEPKNNGFYWILVILDWHISTVNWAKMAGDKTRH